METKRLPIAARSRNTKSTVELVRSALHTTSARPLTLHRAHRVRAKLDDIRRHINHLETSLAVLDRLSEWLDSDDLRERVMQAGSSINDRIKPELERAERIIEEATQAYSNSLAAALKSEIETLAARKLREPLEAISDTIRNLLVSGGY